MFLLDIIKISIHVPRTGHDNRSSTATWPRSDFNPRAPYGARPKASATCCSPSHFNPRAPYGARPICPPAPTSPKRFQSTCPVRGTTIRPFSRTPTTPISIHVPRTGHDAYPQTITAETPDISIHVPRTGHDWEVELGKPVGNEFQSTCPVRGTTAFGCGWSSRTRISIHVPRTGHDHYGVQYHSF